MSALPEGTLDPTWASDRETQRRDWWNVEPEYAPEWGCFTWLDPADLSILDDIDPYVPSKLRPALRASRSEPDPLYVQWGASHWLQVDLPRDYYSAKPTARRSKRQPYTCGKCAGVGHNRRSCKA